MAAPKTLKVYVTPIGFHDAYVAAASRKAALAAWGSTHDLFARGIAQVVADPALSSEALAHPGEVIKRLRGTTAEQIAALPPDAAHPKKKASGKRTSVAPAPRPSRAALDKAEAAIAAAEAEHETALAALEEREQALRRERSAVEERHARRSKGLAQLRDTAEQAYRAELEAWEG